MRDRIKYLDVAKFIGIFCIYLGHMGELAGNAYNFVFTFHVPLFFFLSGCTETIGSDLPWYKYILKIVKSILIPFYFFAFTSLFIYCIILNTYEPIISHLPIILRGCIRNHYFASGLWFLTCLFVVKIVFHFLRKLLKYKIPIFIVSLILFWAAEHIINPHPLVTPHVAYNIDSACYYFVYYALGYCLFKPIHQLFAWDSPTKKIVCAGIGILCAIFAGSLFFGKCWLLPNNNTVIIFINTLLLPTITIFFILLVSKLLENVSLFIEIGKNSLFLCGSEFMITNLFPSCLAILGLSHSLPNPIATYFYVFILLFICNKTLVPIEKAVLRKFHFLNNKESDL